MQQPSNTTNSILKAPRFACNVAAAHYVIPACQMAARKGGRLCPNTTPRVNSGLRQQQHSSPSAGSSGCLLRMCAKGSLVANMEADGTPGGACRTGTAQGRGEESAQGQEVQVQSVARLGARSRPAQQAGVWDHKWTQGTCRWPTGARTVCRFG